MLELLLTLAYYGGVLGTGAAVGTAWSRRRKKSRSGLPAARSRGGSLACPRGHVSGGYAPGSVTIIEVFEDREFMSAQHVCSRCDAVFVHRTPIATEEEIEMHRLAKQIKAQQTDRIAIAAAKKD